MSIEANEEGVLLSIITINYNGISDTCNLLNSIPLIEQFEIIVVDNASMKNEASVIRQRYPTVKVISSNRNLGFAGGNNLGIKAAKGQFLLFINNDTYLIGTTTEKINSLQVLIDRLESSPSIGIVCPKIRFAWGNKPIQYAGYTPLSRITLRNKSIGFGEEDHGQYDIPHPTPYAHGAAMMVKREAIERVGQMPECFFLYYEELDWSMMFTRAGYNIWYDPACTVFHKESQSTGQDSPLKTYYISRNRLLLAQRNMSIPIRYISYCYLIGLVALRDIARHLINRRKDLLDATTQGIKDFFKSHYGYKEFKHKQT
ncbi:MAG: glycosyltransferase family 2 protein [Prevotella sp.]|nr:glycosyltransferase family 2 protein [Prevotella sp.]